MYIAINVNIAVWAAPSLDLPVCFDIRIVSGAPVSGHNGACPMINETALPSHAKAEEVFLLCNDHAAYVSEG